MIETLCTTHILTFYTSSLYQRKNVETAKDTWSLRNALVKGLIRSWGSSPRFWFFECDKVELQSGSGNSYRSLGGWTKAILVPSSPMWKSNMKVRYQELALWYTERGVLARVRVTSGTWYRASSASPRTKSSLGMTDLCGHLPEEPKIPHDTVYMDGHKSSKSTKW